MSNVRFVAHCAPAKIGGRSSNSGTPWPGHVLAALDQQLGRARRDAHLHAATMRRLDDLEQPALVEPGVGDDDLVERLVVRARARARARARTLATKS